MARGHRFHIDQAGHSVTVQVTGPHGAVEVLVDGKVVAYRPALGRETCVLDAELPQDPPRPMRILLAPVEGLNRPPLCLLESDHTRYLMPLVPQPARITSGRPDFGAVRVLRRRMRRMKRRAAGGHR
ncbi:hypothetical protein [Streptomyces sp. Da 82-17]|uniref:hypothetical protein n=1 Tax=Streptomyces sp. Da 82-17 TaxID=3377116 RepID=UPI0038D4CC5F